jgi:hypothetical protein
MVLLRWSVGAVGAGSVPGGAVSGARFGVMRLDEGRVPSRDYVGRGSFPKPGGLGVGGLGVGELGVGGLGVGVKRISSRHRGPSLAMALHVTKSVGRSLRFSAFLSVRPKFFSGNPIGRSVTTPHDLQHSRAYTDSHNSHNTQHTGVKQNKLCFIKMGT